MTIIFLNRSEHSKEAKWLAKNHNIGALKITNLSVVDQIECKYGSVVFPLLIYKEGDDETGAFTVIQGIDNIDAFLMERQAAALAIHSESESERKNLVILIAIDDVLRRLMVSIRLYLEANKIIKPGMFRPAINGDFSASYPEIDKKVLYDIVFNSEATYNIFRYAPCYTGSQAFIKELKERGHKVILTTTQPDKTRYPTEQWIIANEIEPDDVYFFSENESKASKDGDILLDDKPENVEEFRKAGKIAFLLERPYNETVRGLPKSRGFKGFVGSIIKYYNG